MQRLNYENIYTNEASVFEIVNIKKGTVRFSKLKNINNGIKYNVDKIIVNQGVVTDKIITPT
jgi:hypothetical protein